MLTIPTNLQPYFNRTYDNLPAAVFEDSKSYTNFAKLLGDIGVSFKTKIIKGKRAGISRRSFVVMALSPSEKPNGP
jgi:hypothetical protein